MAQQLHQPVGLVRRIAAATIVASGLALAWAFVLVWVINTLEQTVFSVVRTVPYEALTVTLQGMPVIESHAAENYQEITYRHLDGRPLAAELIAELSDNSKLRTLQSANLSAPSLPPRFFSALPDWGQSWGASDFNKPRTSWYLIRESGQPKSAYFVGYDQFSNRLVGYLGRKGFRPSLPPRDEWFHSNPQGAGDLSAASIQGLTHNAPADWYRVVNSAAESNLWLIFLLDEDRLLKVDLRAREVHEIYRSPGLISIGILTDATSTSSHDREEVGLVAKHRVAVRTLDRLLIFHDAFQPTPDQDGTPATVALPADEFLLPEALREKSLYTYATGDDELLLHWSEQDHQAGERQHLAWLSPHGQLTREESFQFAQNIARRGRNEPFDSVLIGVALPVPLGWGSVIGILSPVFMLNGRSEPTYAAAVSSLLAQAWPGAIVVALTGIISAIMVARWQRKYFRRHTGAWCTFAFLLGPAGLLAYRLEMNRARLEECGECHEIVPRDRDACAACEKPFATPALVGTEIFA
ncbi:MAG: hypothetical protein KF708_19305 [Pirellulales bacterium]|nr:hypothetical protein [Pirellulales bacterium]